MRRLLEEERLHAEAMGWLSTNREYRQVFEDPDEATNARLDSVGLLAGRPCFIEVKRSIGPGESRHIESKLSGSFLGHADPENAHPQFVAMRSIWDGRTFPLVATIARRHTANGLNDLSKMLDARSHAWQFDYEIWEWAEDRLVTLASGSPSMECSRDPQVFIEKISIGARPRAPAATIEELRGIAKERGVLDLFDHAIELGQGLGFKLDRRTASVTLTPKRGVGWMPILPDASSAELGLVIDCTAEIAPDLGAMPVKPLGPGLFTYTRYAVKDRDVLTRILHASADVAFNRGDR